MFAFSLLPPAFFLLFLQSDDKNMNLQLVKEKCHCLKAFLHLASLRHCLGFVCLTFCLLCRPPVASCRMWLGCREIECLFFFLEELKIVTSSPCTLLVISPVLGVKSGCLFHVLPMHLMCPGGLVSREDPWVQWEALRCC